jgi:hypothetical protein
MTGYLICAILAFNVGFVVGRATRRMRFHVRR